MCVVELVGRDHVEEQAAAGTGQVVESRLYDIIFECATFIADGGILDGGVSLEELAVGNLPLAAERNPTGAGGLLVEVADVDFLAGLLGFGRRDLERVEARRAERVVADEAVGEEERPALDHRLAVELDGIGVAQHIDVEPVLFAVDVEGHGDLAHELAVFVGVAGHEFHGRCVGRSRAVAAGILRTSRHEDLVLLGRHLRVLRVEVDARLLGALGEGDIGAEVVGLLFDDLAWNVDVGRLVEVGRLGQHLLAQRPDAVADEPLTWVHVSEVLDGGQIQRGKLLLGA